MALINVKQAAELTGLDRQTIINWGFTIILSPNEQVNVVMYLEIVLS